MNLPFNKTTARIVTLVTFIVAMAVVAVRFAMPSLDSVTAIVLQFDTALFAAYMMFYVSYDFWTERILREARGE
jgi:hypothetical protein